MSFKIGNKVNIIGNKNNYNYVYHKFKIGSIGEIIYVDRDYCHVKGELVDGRIANQIICNKDLKLYNDSDKYFFIEYEVEENV